MLRLHLFFDKWRTCIALSTRSSAIFLYVVHFLRLLLLVLFRNNFICLHETSLVLFVHLALPMVNPAKTESTSVRVVFLLSIFELFLRQIQRFLKQWALCCAFHYGICCSLLFCCAKALQIKPSVTCFGIINA
jgi:hypothetical protein